MGHRKADFSLLSVLMFVLILAITAVALADVKLPAVIGDNMVLQQKTKAPIWGWAEPNEEVSITADWQHSGISTKTDKAGKWIIKIQTPEAGGPYSMTIKGCNEIVIKNILIGEVWLCSGQSNMAMLVSTSANSQQEIAAANYPQIRIFTVEKRSTDTPQKDCKGSWLLCSPQTVQVFSAVAYFFGRELYKNLNVPVGLINTSYGGTPAEAWTKKEVLQSEPDFKPIFDRYEQAVKDFPEATKKFEKALAEWERNAAQAKAEGKPEPQKPASPYGPGHNKSPSGLYNSMIVPLIPYAIRGAIWYQGEANAVRAYQYRKLFPAMIKNWRDDWGQGEFPFFFYSDNAL